MGFFQGTQERVRKSRGKRVISVRATEVLLYISLFGPLDETFEVRGSILGQIAQLICAAAETTQADSYIFDLYSYFKLFNGFCIVFGMTSHSNTATAL